MLLLVFEICENIKCIILRIISVDNHVTGMGNIKQDHLVQ